QIVVQGRPEELKRGLEGDAVQLELADGRVEEARRVLERAGAREEALIDGKTLVARVEHGGRALPGLLAALDAEGVGVASVAVSRPSLDDVYLHFTGRDFETEDREGA
ncbi:MAG TPA: DUF4162 domain-containing protein, partial [Gaiellaceae bacterium]